MHEITTFSIVAYDPQQNAWGIAVASKFLAVGAVVPWARANAGAVATQSYANTSYGPQGLALMEAGTSASDALNKLLATDTNADLRQVGLVDVQGRPASHTGSSCHPWAGGITGDNFAVQGNLLSGPGVVSAMALAYTSGASHTFHWRLYEALRAGDAEGGDRRGRQSACILIVKPNAGYGGYNDRWIDYRVDDDPSPIEKLGDILRLHELYFGKSLENERIHLVGRPLIKMQTLMRNLGYYRGPTDGQYSEDTKIALGMFLGNENFEERANLEQGWVDRQVLEYLFKHFGE